MGNNNERQRIRISVEEAKKRFDENDVTILDVVDPGAYKKLSQQIKGAVRIDPRKISDEYGNLPKDRTVLAYCT